MYLIHSVCLLQQTLQSRVAGSSLHSATKSTSCAARRQQTAQAVVVRAVDTSQQTEDASDTSQQLAVLSKQTVKLYTFIV
ncbi:hypothetical protein J6590_087467 [Homalodisca vitripennis]|nr:hypothetical protein J6590_087467 [Homalodisca vitripennis]